MKTLEEAIRYYEEQAKKCNNRVNEIILGAERCKQEKEENTQLADWLRELQERRKQPEIIRCKECINYGNIIHFCSEHCDHFNENYFCGDAERRTDD